MLSVRDTECEFSVEIAKQVCGESSGNEVVVSLGSFQSDNPFTDFKNDYVIKATQPSIAVNSDLSTGEASIPVLQFLH